MVLYYVITIADRDKVSALTEIYKDCQMSMVLSCLGSGTATNAILSSNGLSAKKKCIVSGIAGPDGLKQLRKRVRKDLSLDIPGNGIMMAIPIKSIGGRKNMAVITEKTVPGTDVPDMNFDHELIIVVLNEGHSDDVMDAAREAGAMGGTVLHAKGTAAVGARSFFGLSLADEKDVIYIAADVKAKSGIMSAIAASSGPGTPAGAVCFSLPISQVVGIRAAEADA